MWWPVLAWQHDCLWNFVDYIIWNRKTHPKSGPGLLLAAQMKRQERRVRAFCLLALALTSTLIYAISVAFLLHKSQLLWDSSVDRGSAALQESSRTPVPGWDCYDNQSPGPNNYHMLGLFQSLTAIVGSHELNPVSQSNKCLLNTQRNIYSNISVPLESTD